MQGIFAAINSVFGFIGPLSDFLWDFSYKYGMVQKYSYFR